MFDRANKLIRFFSKTFLKDKFLRFMIVLMTVLCIACFVLILLEKSKISDEANKPL